MNQKGSTLLEAVLGLSFLFTLVVGAIQIGRAVAAHLWLSDVLYRYLICLEEGHAPQTCRRIAERSSQLMPLGTDQIRLTHQGFGRSTKAQLDWQGWGSLQLHLKQQLDLRSK